MFMRWRKYPVYILSNSSATILALVVVSFSTNLYLAIIIYPTILSTLLLKFGAPRLYPHHTDMDAASQQVQPGNAQEKIQESKGPVTSPHHPRRWYH